MQNAIDGSRRAGGARPQQLSTSNDVATSNSTTNHFLGTQQRSWMKLGAQTYGGVGSAGLSRPQRPPKPQRSNTTPAFTSKSNSATTTTVTEITAPHRTNDISNPVASYTSPVPFANTPLPSYRFVPVPISNTSPDEAARSQHISDGHGQKEGSSTSQYNQIEHYTREALASNAVSNTGAMVSPTQADVVDLTDSQDHVEVIQRSEQQQQRREQGQLTRANTCNALDSPALLSNLQERPSIVSPVSTAHVSVANPTNHARAASQLLTPAASPLNQLDQSVPRKRPLEDPVIQQPQTRIIVNSAQESRLNQGLALSTGYQPLHGTRELQASNVQVAPSVSDSHRNALHTIHQQQQQPPHRSSSLSGRQPVQQMSPFHPTNQPRIGVPLQDQAHHGQSIRRRSHSYVLVSQQPTPQVSYRGFSYLATLDSTIGDIARRSNLSSAARDLRIPWIRDACQKNDLFFLLLNQLFCTWTLNRQLLHALDLDSKCDFGFRVLELLFASNTELPNELVAFLAGWPNSTYSLKASPELSQWITTIRRFLPQLGVLWENFRRDCLLRKVPPFAREIIEVFHCPTSVVFPRAVFSSIDRQMHPHAPPALQSATYELFVQNQQMHYARLFQTSTQAPPKTTEEDFRVFASSYRNLIAQYRPAPGFPNAGPSQPSAGTQAPNVIQQPVMTNNIQQEQPHPGQNPNSQTALLQSQTGPVPTHVGTQITRPINVTLPSSASIPNGVGHQSRSVAPSRGSFVLASQLDAVHPVQNSRVAIRNDHPAQLTTMSALTSQNSGNILFSNRHSAAGGSSMDNILSTLLPDLTSLPPFIVNPVPEQEALHQAHLRQPMTQVKDAKAGQTVRLFQMIEFCVLEPRVWKPEDSFFSLDFEVPADLMERKAEASEPLTDSFQIPKRVLSSKSILFNLRCTQINPTSQTVDENEWAALATYWPQHIFISINSNHLEIRRKRHHKRDLPIDVTPYVVYGTNNVKVSIHPEKSDEGKKFGIAVEAIGLHDVDEVRKMPGKLSSDESLMNIKGAMQPTTDTSDNDDEMQVVTDSIVLSMTDPFLSSMFTIPVRGKTCKHRECFDLETFLESRTSDNNDALTSFYQWQCPTCGKDARPASLVIDGFLQEVRDRLVADGKSDARAIIVQADGTWTVKPERDRDPSRNKVRSKSTEKFEGVESMLDDQTRSTSLSHRNSEKAGDVQSSATTIVVEIIDLDDD